MNKDKNRLIPTDDSWYNYKDNRYCAWLFSFMSSSASYYNKRLYYPKKKYIKDIKLIENFLGIKKRTIDKYINKLLKLNYIEEDKENYYIMNHTEETYLLMNRELLYNICITKSFLTIQIFVYLMDRMNMKQKNYNNNTYNFTIKEIKTILGYSPNTQNYQVEQAIKEVIQTLKAESYINYESVYIETEESNKGNYKIPNYLLTYVCNTIPIALQEIKKIEE